MRENTGEHRAAVDAAPESFPAETVSRVESKPHDDLAHREPTPSAPQIVSALSDQVAPPAMVPDEKPVGTAAASSQQPLVADEIVREEPPVAEPIPPARPILEFDWQSDLTQIETDREKLKAAQANVQEEQAAVPRKRERPVPPAVSDEPLVQVETSKPKPESESASPMYRHSDSEVVPKAAAH